MKKIIKAILGFLLTVVGEVIAGIILSYINNVNFISGFWIAIKASFKYLWLFITFKVPLWIIVMIIVIFYIIKKYWKRSKCKIPTKSNKEILLETYTEDIYDGMNYRWRWCNTSNGPSVMDLMLICKCGCVLDYDIFDYDIQCPDCKKKYANNVDERAAERTFENRFRKKLKELDAKETLNPNKK